MTTTLDLINWTLGHLQSNAPQPANRLNGAVTSGQTNIPFKYNLERIVPQALIAIELEEIMVWETDSLKTATVVERGVNGSTQAAHDDLDSVLVQPRFSWFRILNALNNSINGLSSPANGLYQIKIVPQFTFQSGVYAYDLAGVTAEDDILAVDYQLPGSSGVWHRLADDDFDVARDQNTTSFPSGFSITFPFGGMVGQAYRIAYRAPFTTLSTSSLTTDVATTGLPATAYDIPPLDAAIELLAGREIQRNFTEDQGNSRRAAEVPPGAVAASANPLLRRRRDRVMAEAARLAARYPTMLRSR